MRRKALVVPILVVAAAALAGCNALGDADYCLVDCRQPGVVHTLCAYHRLSRFTCELLGYANVRHGLTAEEKNAIVRLHNALRWRVAAGYERRGRNWSQPAAKEMKELLWDQELEYVGQRWADQCVSTERELLHDQCRSRADGEPVGQNAGMKRDIVDPSVEEQVLAWYSEVDSYDGSDAYRANRYASSPLDRIGHYTQLVNAKTDRVGCGAVRYSLGPHRYLFLYCNYSPSGNYPDEQTYLPVDQYEPQFPARPDHGSHHGGHLFWRVPVRQAYYDYWTRDSAARFSLRAKFSSPQLYR